MPAYNDPFIIQSPFYMVEGESYKVTVRIKGATTIASPVTKIYNNNDDTSGTNLADAATSNGVDTITSGTLQNLVGGEIYWLNFSGTINSKLQVYLLEIRVLHPWGAM